MPGRDFLLHPHWQKDILGSPELLERKNQPGVEPGSGQVLQVHFLPHCASEYQIRRLEVILDHNADRIERGAIKRNLHFPVVDADELGARTRNESEENHHPSLHDEWVVH
jgi:hypothetical protein